MHNNKDLLRKTLPLFVAMIIFVTFGTFHLTKFETTDEHFWKYDRIKKYYNGIHDGFTENDWKKTRINDKPGVLVAILSGIGLPFAPDPEQHRNTALEESTRYYDEGSERSLKLYDIFFTERTEQINFALRLPILLFNALIVLPLLFYLLWQAFSPRIAQITIILIGMNPILIGISQIINPDAVLWGTSAVAIMSFYAFLAKRERKFVIICGIATGLALLSKYTANLLFIFYPIIFFLHSLFEKNSLEIQEYIRSFLSITLLSWIVFLVLMPAVLQKPAHFLYGTVYSPVLSAFVDPVISLTKTHNIFFIANGDYRTIPLFFLSITLFVLITIAIPVATRYLFREKREILQILLSILAILFVATVITSLINVWFHAPFFSLENIKESSQELEELSFPQIAHYPHGVRLFLAFTMQAQNMIFSLHSLTLFATIVAAISVIAKRNRKIDFGHVICFPFIALTIFIIGGLASDIFVNVRYGIMLYVPFALIAGVIIVHMIDWFNQRSKNDHMKQKTVFFLALTVIAICHTLSLMLVKPHYFNYENILLPKKYTVTDSWGYGIYEAAMYLNSLDNAHDVIVWSDRDGLCQFFVGKCISPHKIAHDHTNIDYFVFTRRGIIRKPFVSQSSDPQKILDRDHYYSDAVLDNPQWELHINDRPENFIKVIRVVK
jgi:hypothetical protein